MAAAIGSSMSMTWRAPAFWAASLTARRSTSVIPDGTQMTIRPIDVMNPGFTRLMNPRMRASATEKSAMTPSLSGRIVSMSLCVRSCIMSASVPIATGFPERRSMATIEGSFRTIPLSWTWMRVLAVPRSMATSTENGLSTGGAGWRRQRTGGAPAAHAVRGAGVGHAGHAAAPKLTTGRGGPPRPGAVDFRPPRPEAPQQGVRGAGGPRRRRRPPVAGAGRGAP